MAQPGTAVEFGEVVDLGRGQVRVAGQLELLRIDGGIRPLRLPSRYWPFFPPADALLRAITARPSGVRISLRTSATRLELHVRCTQLGVVDSSVAEGRRLLEANSFVICVDGEEVANFASPVDAHELVAADGEGSEVTRFREHSVVSLADLAPRDKVIDVWLPQMVMVDLLDLEANARFDAAEPPVGATWIHHGSSISHGGQAPKPTSVWPVVAAREAGLSLINLGFAGQCMLDPFVADAIAATPAHLISLELGINVVGARSMDQRTFVPALHGFLDRVRTGHPSAPLLVISPIVWPGNEDTAGPTLRVESREGHHYTAVGTLADVQAGALSLRLAREHIEHVVQVRARAGEHIHYVHGHDLYGPDDARRRPLPDGLHPDGDTHEEIGHRFARHALIDSWSRHSR